MKAADHCGPARSETQAVEGYRVSAPDEHGNRFITVLGADGEPLPPDEPTEGA